MSIIATDYDKFLIDNASNMFPNIQCETYDFYKCNIEEYMSSKEIDMVVMFGSACSMNTEKYIDFLQKLNVKYVITLEAGIEKAISRFKRHIIVALITVKKFIFKENLNDSRHGFHAYSRTVSELKKVFDKSGYSYHRIKGLKCYQYVYLLEKR